MNNIIHLQHSAYYKTDLQDCQDVFAIYFNCIAKNSVKFLINDVSRINLQEKIKKMQKGIDKWFQLVYNPIIDDSKGAVSNGAYSAFMYFRDINRKDRREQL